MPVYNAPLRSINEAELLRYAGLGKKTDFAPDLVAEACEEVLLLSRVRGVWREFDYDASSKTICAPSPLTLRGEKIGAHLANCERVIVLCVTIGEEVETAISDHFAAKNYTLPLLMDAAATTAVEQAADGLEKAVRVEAKKRGFAMRFRFSPGYGDWPLEQQKEVLALSGGESIGVTLTESLMLMPRKSVTAVIGLTREQGEEKKSRCASCSKIDCFSRKTAG